MAIMLVAEMHAEQFAQMLDERLRIAMETLAQKGEKITIAVLLQRVNNLRDEVSKLNERIDKAAKAYAHVQAAIAEHDAHFHQLLTPGSAGSDPTDQGPL
jgi:flagellar biosynthesis chaperone FliJ